MSWGQTHGIARYWTIFLLNLTLVTIGTFPAHASAPSRLPADSEKSVSGRQKIMVFGDSLSAGYGIAAQDGWVALMEAKLKDRGVVIINASISGETTIGGANRIKTDLARHKPTMVLLALGANDGLRGLPVADMRHNLSAIVDEIRKTNARTILIGIQIPPNYGIDYTNNFKAVFTTLAKQRKLPLIPFLLDGIADKLENFQADRLHPTAAAQPRILANVLPVVENMLAKSRTPLQ